MWVFGRSASGIRFSICFVLVIALGAGTVGAIADITRQILLQPLPFKNSSRLATIWESIKGKSDRLLLPVGEVSFLQTEAHTVESVTFYSLPKRAILMDAPHPSQAVLVAGVSDNTLQVLGIDLNLGRSFSADDFSHRSQVALLSYRLWGARFGFSPDVIGRDIQIDGVFLRVIGVLPRHFTLALYDVDMLVPLQVLASGSTQDMRVAVLGLLRSGKRISDLQSELNGLRDRVAPFHQEPGDIVLTSVSLEENTLGYLRSFFVIIGISALLILVIAVSNAMSLLLIRSIRRRQEFAIRSALGASVRHLINLVAQEGLFLAALAGGVGVIIAYAVTHLFLLYLPEDIPRIDQLHFGAWQVAIVIAVTFAGAGACFTVPLGKAIRSRFDPDIKPDRKTVNTKADRTWQRILLIAQTGITASLLFGCLLVAGRFIQLRQTYPGFQANHIISGRFVFSKDKTTDKQQIVSFYQRLSQLLDAQYSDADVCITTALPFTSASHIDALINSEGSERAFASVASVSPGCFTALQIPLIQGRTFQSGDTAGSHFAVVNRYLASRYFEKGSPVGKEISVGLEGTNDLQHFMIIGVVDDIKQWDMADLPQPQLYYFFTERPERTLYFAIRGHRNDALSIKEISQQLTAMESGVAIHDVEFLNHRIDRTLGYHRLAAGVIALFAICSLILAMLGLYSTINFFVLQQRRELSIRQAIGGVPWRLACGVVVDTGGLVLMGLGFACLFSIICAGVLRRTIVLGNRYTDLLHDSHVLSLQSCFLLLMITLSLTIIPAIGPALSVLKLDPAQVLREE